MCRENPKSEPFLHKRDYFMKNLLTILCKNIDKKTVVISEKAKKVCLKS